MLYNQEKKAGKKSDIAHGTFKMEQTPGEREGEKKETRRTSWRGRTCFSVLLFPCALFPPWRSLLLSGKDSPLPSLRVGHAVDGKEPVVTGELVGSCSCWLLTTQLVLLLVRLPAADTDTAAHPADRFQMTNMVKWPHNTWSFEWPTPWQTLPTSVFSMDRD